MASRREIINKIEKLYALASGGAAPSEAKAAIDLAVKLMKKYNINESEVNKHTYTHGQQKSRQREEPQRHGFYEEPFREHYKQNEWYKNYEKREDYTSWDFRYSQGHIDPGFVRADVNRETDKAFLLNVYLDPSKYPWSRQMKIVVSAWYPKSKVIAHIKGVFLLDKQFLIHNLKDNIPWLLKNHSVFKGYRGEIVFHILEGIK